MSSQNMAIEFQDTAPQNMPLQCNDYFKPLTLYKQHMQAETVSELPLSTQRQIFQKPVDCHKSPEET